MRKYTFQRTVTYTTANIVVFDKITKQTNTETIKLTGKFTNKDDKKLFREARKLLEKGNIRVLMVDDFEYNDVLYGMTLEDFLKYATPISKEVTE